MTRRVKLIAALVVVLATGGLCSMGCFSMMTGYGGEASAGERVLAAGADVITLPVQVIVFGAIIVSEGIGSLGHQGTSVTEDAEVDENPYGVPPEGEETP